MFVSGDISSLEYDKLVLMPMRELDDVSENALTSEDSSRLVYARQKKNSPILSALYWPLLQFDRFRRQ
jgi:hypothetical protein